MAELSEGEIEDILKGIKIPPQPQIMVDLQMEQAMPDPDVNRISELISHDVGLSGTLLKVVNSPLYGLANKISSIQQAVNILGMNTVVNIINGISIKNALSDDSIKSLTRFWDSAMDVAMICTTIAKEVYYPQPDKAYAVGLFHNVGIPMLMMKFEHYLGYMMGGYASVNERIIDFENQQLECNHAVVGYYTAKAWHLDPVVCDIIAKHHTCHALFNEKNMDKDENLTLMAILKLAEHVAGLYMVLGQQKEDHEWNAIGSDVLQYLGLSEEDVETMKAGLADKGISPENYGLI